MDFGILPFPEHTANGVVVGGENIGVIKNKNTEGALEFIRFYNEKENMEEMSDLTMNIPPRREEAIAFGEKNERYHVFVDQMEYGVSRTSVKNWKTICLALSESLYEMFGNGEDSDIIWDKYRNTVDGKKE